MEGRFRDALGVPASGLGTCTPISSWPPPCTRLRRRRGAIHRRRWLDVNYGGLIRALLLGPLGGESIHVLDPAAAVFPDAAATSAITCFRPGRTPRAIRLCQVAGVTGLGGLAGGTPVPVTVLRSASRWRPLAVRPFGPRRAQWPGGTRRTVPGPPRPGDHANKVWITAADDSGLPARFLLPR